MLWTDAHSQFWQACDALLCDHETKDLLNSTFDLMIIDGAYPGIKIQIYFDLKQYNPFLLK